METCTASPMDVDRHSPGSYRSSGQRPEDGRADAYAALEHELDRRENAERCVEDVREVDFSVFLLLGMAVLILIGVVVVIVL